LLNDFHYPLAMADAGKMDVFFQFIAKGVKIQGFCKECHGAQIEHCPLDRIVLDSAGQDDDRNIPGERMRRQSGEDVVALAIGHAVVGDDQVG
jgi:hypothetical protein